MKHMRFQIILGLSLIALSALFYFVHYLIFNDLHHIFIYLVGDIAFVPIEVLLVTMILHKLLEDREKKSKFKKLNMVIETFFSEMGMYLIKMFSDADSGLESIRDSFMIRNNWSSSDFKRAAIHLKKYEFKADIRKIELNDLHGYLAEKRDFVMRLLQNPVMLEHETFTDLIRAILHLTEELASRDGFENITDTDYEHLAGDIQRAYSRLVNQWMNYMEYLKLEYPYLFSLAIRTNPFDENAKAAVE
ncbi:MAG TPA: hypothetical protein ENH45_03085 [Nitrospirae bacterium]|nr:hypothetical protein BMS3Abin09_00318 [bacterium BMS3Abin09]GBE41572.1 hypothetical protein BMS3Bbin09_01478 [bacterium BMS3Bbin09]HDZ84180.1 hypothetical protein [Nitrospirota bacterium]